MVVSVDNKLEAGTHLMDDVHLHLYKLGDMLPRLSLAELRRYLNQVAPGTVKVINDEVLTRMVAKFTEKFPHQPRKHNGFLATELKKRQIGTINNDSLVHFESFEYKSMQMVSGDQDVRRHPVMRQQTPNQDAIQANDEQEPTLSDAGSEHLLAQRAAEFLQQNLGLHVQLNQVARELGVNRNKLTKAFKRTWGSSVMNWLRQQRLTKAAELLRQSDASILTIATTVGYQDSNNFSTAFKRRYRLSPTQFRRRHLQSLVA